MTASTIPLLSDTKTRILNAAENLFGKNGFDATSLRDITAEAQVNLAAINYHFQTKDSLVDAVIERRFQPVNQRRFEMLEAAGANPTVEQIVDAFLAPMLFLEVRVAFPLIGRVLSNPNQFLDRVYKKHLLPVVEKFSNAIGKALPELPPSERFWRLHFMAGAMTHVLALSEVLPVMSGSTGELDKEALVKRLAVFLVAGLCAPESRESLASPAKERHSPIS